MLRFRSRDLAVSSHPTSPSRSAMSTAPSGTQGHLTTLTNRGRGWASYSSEPEVAQLPWQASSQDNGWASGPGSGTAFLPSHRAMGSRQALCLWLPTFELRLELVRTPELDSTSVALLSPGESTRRTI